MKIVYIGSPSFSADILKQLISDKESLSIDVTAVITQPDQPVGRKKIMTPTAVKLTAEELSIPVYTNLSVIKGNTPDLVILFAYGEIIPQWALDLPQFGFWNIHPSLLPEFRGASPISFPLVLGKTETGTTLMQMDADLDHGAILLQEKYNIRHEDTQLHLQEALTKMSYSLLRQLLMKVQHGEEIEHREQVHNSATYTRPLEKKDGFIPFDIVRAAYGGDILSFEQAPELITDWYTRNTLESPPSFNAAQVVYNMYRGLKGWPGVWTTISVNGTEKRLALHEMGIENNTLVIKSVQLEGKTQIEFSTFNAAYKIL